MNNAIRIEPGDVTPYPQPEIGYEEYVKRIKKEPRWLFHPKYGQGWSAEKYNVARSGVYLRVFFSDIQEEHNVPVDSVEQIAVWGKCCWSWHKIVHNAQKN